MHFVITEIESFYVYGMHMIYVAWLHVLWFKVVESGKVCLSGAYVDLRDGGQIRATETAHNSPVVVSIAFHDLSLLNFL